MPVQRRGSKIYFAALGVAQLCALVRYTALARLLGPEQLGMAALIVLTGQFFDSLTDTGNDRFLIQDRGGDTVEAFRMVELVALMRGTAMAVLIVVLAGPVAALARAPQVTNGLRVFALVPFVAGFTNYDYRVAQRAHQFRPEAWVVIGSELAGLAATVVAALLTRNFTAILYGLCAKALVAVLLSQAVAKRGYSLGYEATLARRIWLFGAPLMINGLLLFVASQSDRMIVSRMLGLQQLGRYSVVVLLVLYPTSTVMRFIAGMFLPLVAGARDDPRAERAVVDQLGGILMLVCTGICVGFAIVAPFAIPLIFGAVYAQSSLLAALVGTMIALRLFREWPTTAALAWGRSGIVLATNVFRLISVPMSLIALALTGSLEGLVGGLLIGEIAGNVGGLFLVNRAAHWPALTGAERYLGFIGVAAIVMLWTAGGWERDSLMAASLALATLALTAAVLWRERHSLSGLWSSVRNWSFG